MIDYVAIQLTGSACQGRNCAAASGAMAVYFGTAGRVKLTADQFRSRSGSSCIPGVHSPSGGLYISDVQRVAYRLGVAVEYGRDSVTYYKRWTVTTMRYRLARDYGAIVLGDYDALPLRYRASSTFLGDHSAWAHAYRASDDTVCWHDPLRSYSIRLPFAAMVAYWWKPTSPIRGFAGFVRIPAPPPVYRIYVKRGAKVRLYTLKGTCIDMDAGYDDSVWNHPDSSALAGAKVRRLTCDGKSAATIAYVRSGAFAGRYIRTGAIYGVIHKEIT